MLWFNCILFKFDFSLSQTQNHTLPCRKTKQKGKIELEHLYSICYFYQVSKPNIGETRPSRVRADVTINLNMRDIVKGEWEGMILTTYSGLSFNCSFTKCDRY